MSVTGMRNQAGEEKGRGVRNVWGLGSAWWEGVGIPDLEQAEEREGRGLRGMRNGNVCSGRVVKKGCGMRRRGREGWVGGASVFGQWAGGGMWEE